VSWFYDLEPEVGSIARIHQRLLEVMAPRAVDRLIRESGKAYTAPVLAERNRAARAARGEVLTRPLWDGKDLDARGVRRVRERVANQRTVLLQEAARNGGSRAHELVGDLTVGDLADLAVYHWADAHFRARAKASGQRVNSKKLSEYGTRAVLAVSSGLGKAAIFEALASFYHGRQSESGEGGVEVVENDIEKDRDRRGEPEGRGKSGEKVNPDSSAGRGTGEIWNYTRCPKGTEARAVRSRGKVSLEQLAQELADALRPRIVPDDTGESLRAPADVAAWACGIEPTPFGESVAALASPVELMVFVDASSSTSANAAHDAQHKVATEIVKACRAAGHLVAVAPWGNWSGSLESREALGWSEPLPEVGIGWYPNCGTDPNDAMEAVRQLRATSPSAGRARGVALILTDGDMSLPEEYPRGVTCALWALGSSAQIPAGWQGPSMMSRNLDTVGVDLAASDLVRFLSGLGG
jgi:hypothetical protein